MSAYLAPKTRLMLETLISQQSSSATPEYVHDPNRPSQYSSKDHSLPLGTQLPYREGSPVVGHVEIPLSADSRFFRLLSMEISSLGTLQEEQETVLKGRIVHLGQSIATITVPSKNSSKTDLFIWREIFRLYIDSEIFFSVTGNHRGILNPTLAHQRLQEFGRRLAEVHIRESFKRKASYEALDNFLGINFDLLRNLKFQELNVMAMTKILKSSIGHIRQFKTDIDYVQNLIRGHHSARGTNFPISLPRIHFRHLC